MDLSPEQPADAMHVPGPAEKSSGTHPQAGEAALGGTIQASYSQTKRFRRRGFSTRVLGRWIAFLLVWIGAAFCVAPLAYTIVQSFIASPSGRFRRPPIAAYFSLLYDQRLWIAFKNTAIEEAIILTTVLFFCPLAGYAFAKFTFRGKGTLFAVMMLTICFVPIAQSIPLLLEMNQLGWLDTYQGLIIPMTISSLGIFWMTLVIRGVPDEQLHAARIDGCGSFLTWWWIVLPNVKPALLALAFFTFLTAYNDFMWPLLVLPDDAMQTVSLYLYVGQGYSLQGGGGSTAALVMTSLPTVVVFLIMQRYFMPQLLRRTGYVAALDAVDVLRFQPAAVPGGPIRGFSQGDALPQALPMPPGAAARAGQRIPAGDTALALVGLRPWPGAWPVHLVRCALIAACAILVFLNALQNSLHLDDVYRVIGNPGIQTFWPFWRHFTDPFTSASIPSMAQFRPLLPLTLSINYALGGDSLLGYHLGNLLIAIVVGWLTYFLVRELLGYWAALRLPGYRVDFLAMVVALLVVVHPVPGMLVNYISGRDLLLMQAFLLAALLLYARMQREHFFVERGFIPEGPLAQRLLRRWFGGSIAGWAVVLILFEFALLSKAQAVMLPALILAFEVTLGRATLLRMAPYARALPFALVAVAHLAYVENYLQFTTLPDSGFYVEWTYPLTQAHLTVTHYLANFIWPFGITKVPVVATVQTVQEAGVVLGSVFVLGTLICAWRLRHRLPLLAFCIASYWVAQSPESSFNLMHTAAIDYRPYPAVPFLFLAVALLLEHVRKPAMTAVVLFGLIVYFGAASIYLNALW